MNRIGFLLLVITLSLSDIYAQQNDNIASSQDMATDTIPKTKYDKRQLIPKFTATILGRYEFNTELYTHHFELRHTRIGMSGSPHPMFSYMALVDLTYGGKFSPVAIFAKFTPVKGLSFLIGFDKMPFSNENLLSPYQYYFSDKSFLTQKITAWSDVGGVVSYKWDKVIPFELKAGVFNSGGFDKQMHFQKSLNYVARGTFNFFKGFELSLNYAAVKPEALRMHNLDAGLAYNFKGLHLDAEYIFKWYDDFNFVPTHALQCFAYYAFKMNRVWLDNIAIALRYDAISPNCNGKLNEDGEYTLEPTRQRITAGFTMMFIEKPCRAGIRLNYEKNFFREGFEANEDRLILELIVHY